MNYLKQSTAATIKLGPFVDETDGKTAETGLTIAQADVRLSKNGGDMAQKNDATSATHDELGYYDVPLDATDTGTLGRLKVMVTESGALPVWEEYLVVTANVYDTLCSTDKFDVNAAEIGGVAQSDQYVKVSSGTGTGQISLSSGAVTVGTNNDKTGYTASTVSDKTGYSLSAGGVQAIWDALTSALTTAGSIGKKLADWVAGKVLSYDTGLDPATQILSTPANKLYTSSTGKVDLIDAPNSTAVSAFASAIGTAANQNAIKAKTDNLPTDPADQSAVEAAIAAMGYTLKKNTQVVFPFVMTDSTNHAPATGKTVSATVSKDGGSFTASTNSVAEIANGAYKLTVTATEMNATSVQIRFTATGCDDQIVTIFTQG